MQIDRCSLMGMKLFGLVIFAILGDAVIQLVNIDRVCCSML